jgi:hypothetical protein
VRGAAFDTLRNPIRMQYWGCLANMLNTPPRPQQDATAAKVDCIRTPAKKNKQLEIHTVQVEDVDKECRPGDLGRSNF